MKKIAVTLLIIVLAYNSFGQNCIADQSITKPGIYPSYLDTGTVGIAYEHTLQILAVKDTNVVFMGNPISATVDSIVLDDILGLPGDFTYACEPSRCTFTYQKVGCAKLQGNPKQSDQGEHPLEIIVTSYARWGSFKLPVTDTIRDFVLVINDSALVSLRKFEYSKVVLSPNPTNGNLLNVEVKYPASKAFIMNQQGAQILSLSPNQLKIFSIDITDISVGIYYIYVETEVGLIKEKFIRLQ